jgi:predicted chitinase
MAGHGPAIQASIGGTRSGNAEHKAGDRRMDRSLTG